MELQDQPSKTTSNEQMDKVVKEETDNQNGESRQPPDLQTVAEPCVKLEACCTPPLTQSQEGSAPVPRDSQHKQEEEPHQTHSFTWVWNHKPISMTCNKARTVENLLKNSPKFSKIASKNKDKELVIVRDGKAISSHFPCSLIKNERLIIKYIKAVNKPTQSVSGFRPRQRKGPSRELVMFHLRTRGGPGIVRIMRNPALKIEMTVYAYKGEKVKHALKRDGRLMDIVFKKNCALSNISTEVTTEMSDLVDDLNGETFEIKLLNMSRPPDSQPGSLEDDYTTQNESQRSDLEGNQDPPQQSSTTESVNVDVPKKPAGRDGEKAPDLFLREITNSEKMLSNLSARVKDWLKRMKVSRPNGIQNLLRVEYGKNTQTCREVKTMKTLMELSDSVCHVRANGKPEGSGFLLFDKFVLTNGHVLKNICNVRTGQLYVKVTVHFSYESLDQMGPEVEVEEVTGFEYGCDVSGHKYDWALLRIGADQKLPDVLLTHFGFVPQSGGICIIGHPGGGVKKIDPCFIVPAENRNQVVERHLGKNPEGVVPTDPRYTENQDPINLVTDRFFKDVRNDEENRQALLYETCFYFGSSGSPVFDMHCNVVAMHSGGYPYHNAKGEGQSVIEYGYPLSIVIKHIIVQMVERERFDVLKEYLACSYKHRQIIMDNLKKLVESRNIQAFTYVAKHPEVTKDESLKKFFEFLSQREVPVPMDTD